MPHDQRSHSHGELELGLPPAPTSAPLSPARLARLRLYGAERGELAEIFSDPKVHDALGELVPLIKPSDLVPCVQLPALTGLLVPNLSPLQCKQIGPELAHLIAPHLAQRWTQLAYLPLETVTLLAGPGVAELPAGVLRALPLAHQNVLAPYVKRVRNVSADLHDFALAEGLCKILHLYAHKVLDPEHIPEPLQLRLLQASRALHGKTWLLRWLVDAAMSEHVRVVQLGTLKLTPLIVELRRAGLRELAGELAQVYQDHKAQRNLPYGADAVAYTDGQAFAVTYQPVADLGELPIALRTAVLRHAPLHDEPASEAPEAPEAAQCKPAPSKPAPRTHYPLPTARYAPLIVLDLAVPPSRAALPAIELVLNDQLAASRHGITIEDVSVRFADGSTFHYRRQHNARYRRASSRFAPDAE
jgi:hypothetical protein